MSNLAKKSLFREDRTLNRYLEEIGDQQLINKEEECRLAGLIKTGSQEALEKLVSSNLRFVVSVAKQYQNQGLSLGDLINEGNLGLIKAAKRFDETRGYKFISYAVWWIRQSILQALSEQSRIVRIPLNRVGAIHKIGKTTQSLEQSFGRQVSAREIADELEMKASDVEDSMKIASRHISMNAPFHDGESNTLSDVLHDENDPSPDTDVIKDSLKHEIERVLSTLTQRESEIICLYFGLNREKSLTLDEIGRRFNLTRERVRQIKEKALMRLRHPTRRRTLESYM